MPELTDVKIRFTAEGEQKVLASMKNIEGSVGSMSKSFSSALGTIRNAATIALGVSIPSAASTAVSAIKSVIKTHDDLRLGLIRSIGANISQIQQLEAAYARLRTRGIAPSIDAFTSLANRLGGDTAQVLSTAINRVSRATGIMDKDLADSVSDLARLYDSSLGEIRSFVDDLEPVLASVSGDQADFLQTLQTLAPYAMDAGVSLRELLVVLWEFNLAGVKSGQSIQAIRALLAGIQTGKLEELGVVAVRGTNGLERMNDILRQVKQASDDLGSGALYEIFGPRAAAIVRRGLQIDLEVSLKRLEAERGQNAEREGAISNTLRDAYARLQQSVASLFDEIAKSWRPAIVSVLNATANFIADFKSTIISGLGSILLWSISYFLARFKTVSEVTTKSIQRMMISSGLSMPEDVKVRKVDLFPGSETVHAFHSSLKGNPLFSGLSVFHDEEGREYENKKLRDKYLEIRAKSQALVMESIVKTPVGGEGGEQKNIGSITAAPIRGLKSVVYSVAAKIASLLQFMGTSLVSSYNKMSAKIKAGVLGRIGGAAWSKAQFLGRTASAGLGAAFGALPYLALAQIAHTFIVGIRDATKKAVLSKLGEFDPSKYTVDSEKKTGPIKQAAELLSYVGEALPAEQFVRASESAKELNEKLGANVFQINEQNRTITANTELLRRAAAARAAELDSEFDTKLAELNRRRNETINAQMSSSLVFWNTILAGLSQLGRVIQNVLSWVVNVIYKLVSWVGDTAYKIFTLQWNRIGGLSSENILEYADVKGPIGGGVQSVLEQQQRDAENSDEVKQIDDEVKRLKGEREAAKKDIQDALQTRNREIATAKKKLEERQMQLNERMQERIRQLQIESIPNELERKIAAINDQYKKEMESAKKLGLSLEQIVKAREAEMAAIERQREEKRREVLEEIKQSKDKTDFILDLLRRGLSEDEARKELSEHEFRTSLSREIQKLRESGVDRRTAEALYRQRMAEREAQLRLENLRRNNQERSGFVFGTFNPLAATGFAPYSHLQIIAKETTESRKELRKIREMFNLPKFAV